MNPDDLIPFEELASTVEIVPLDGKIVALTISLRKTHKIKLPDAVIAATALEKSLILLSRNSADFKNIANLELRNLHDMI